VRVIVVAAIAIALYQPLGFLITMSLLLFCLLVLVEKRNVLRAVAFSIGVSLFAYILFGSLLKSPLPHGPLGF